MKQRSLSEAMSTFLGRIFPAFIPFLLIGCYATNNYEQDGFSEGSFSSLSDESFNPDADLDASRPVILKTASTAPSIDDLNITNVSFKNAAGEMICDAVSVTKETNGDFNTESCSTPVGDGHICTIDYQYKGEAAPSITIEFDVKAEDELVEIEANIWISINQESGDPQFKYLKVTYGRETKNVKRMTAELLKIVENSREYEPVDLKDFYVSTVVNVYDTKDAQNPSSVLDSLVEFEASEVTPINQVAYFLPIFQNGYYQPNFSFLPKDITKESSLDRRGVRRYFELETDATDKDGGDDGADVLAKIKPKMNGLYMELDAYIESASNMVTLDVVLYADAYPAEPVQFDIEEFTFVNEAKNILDKKEFSATIKKVNESRFQISFNKKTLRSLQVFVFAAATLDSATSRTSQSITISSPANAKDPKSNDDSRFYFAPEVFENGVKQAIEEIIITKKSSNIPLEVKVEAVDGRSIKSVSWKLLYDAIEALETYQVKYRINDKYLVSDLSFMELVEEGLYTYKSTEYSSLRGLLLDYRDNQNNSVKFTETLNDAPTVTGGAVVSDSVIIKFYIDAEPIRLANISVREDCNNSEIIKMATDAKGKITTSTKVVGKPADDGCEISFEFGSNSTTLDSVLRLEGIYSRTDFRAAVTANDASAPLIISATLSANTR